MADPFVVEVPLVNPNEPEAIVVDVSVADGEKISEGDVLCALETSKSVEDVYAGASGYVAALSSKLGTTVVAGDVLCYISSDPDWTPPESDSDEEADAIPEDLKITEPALAVATELGVDLDTLPRGMLITERTVREIAEKESSAEPSLVEADPRSVVIFGAGGHGKTLIELVRAAGQLDPVGVIDDSAARGSEVLGVPVLGGRDDLAKFRSEGIGMAVNAIGGITNMSTRVEVTATLARAGFTLPAIVHPSAVIEPSATIGAGCQILAHSYVGSDARLTDSVIVNTGAVVSHDCVIGSHANLSPGCLVAGNVTVGARTLLGMGVTTYLGITIGSDVRAGNLTTINADVPDGRRISAGSSWDALS